VFNKIINNLPKGKIMRIMYINNNGGGFADFINVEEGMTIDKLFKQKMPHEEASDYLIRVNRQPVPKDYTLKESDRVTVTPTKIEGA
jgi:sulfur carrier protein ThiS